MLGNIDDPSLLKDSLVIPMGIKFGQSISYSVVFSEKNDLQNCELGILVNSGVT